MAPLKRKAALDAGDKLKLMADQASSESQSSGNYSSSGEFSGEDGSVYSCSENGNEAAASGTPPAKKQKVGSCFIKV